MRIINRESFLKLPEGILFSKYEPCIFEPPCIKRNSTESDDFFYTSIINDVAGNSSGDVEDTLFSAEKNGDGFAMEFDSLERDGCFDADQLFAIWEPEDIKRLITALITTL